MAATVTVNDINVVGDQKMVFATVAFDNSYPTGGEVITPSMFGGRVVSIEDAVVHGTNLAGTRLVAWDRATSAVRLFTAVGTQAANGSDQSAINDVRVVFYCK